MTLSRPPDGGLDCCGAGLHFSPRPFMARRYSTGCRFVACRVRLADLVAITDCYGQSDKSDSTWNPTTGCDRISPGCDHCYALTLAARLKRMGQPRYQRDGDPRTSGPGFGLTMHPDALEIPLRWRKPRMVFVNSMSDLFHKDVDPWFVAQVWGVMAATPQHTYQVLTKRPKRMARVLDAMGRAWTHDAPWPLPNVWLGTSIESREYVWRADHLRAAPAAVRFVSAEPLLGPLVISPRLCSQPYPTYAELSGSWPDGYLGHELDLRGIDWLIVGGESGPRHRPIDVAWVRELRDSCQRTGTAFFFKQWGGLRPKSGGRELDGRTWDEMPIILDRKGAV